MPNSDRRVFLKTVLKLNGLWVLKNSLLRYFQLKNQMLPTWESLVEIARWCPSVHNLQPHKVKVISSHIAELHYDPARLLPIGDPHCIFATVAMGIFIEHLTIAAAAHSAKVKLIELAEPITTSAATLTFFARLELVAADRKEIFSPDLILRRRTSRLPYNGIPLKESVLAKIKEQAMVFDHNFYCSSDEEVIKFVVDLNQQTLFEDLASTPNRKELDHLFRYDKQEALAKKDGLWSRCMNFPGLLMKSIFRNPERWEGLIKQKLIAGYYKTSFKGTATIGWFSGEFEHSKDWLRAGRMLARNWLLLTQEKAYIQPFGSLITNTNAYAVINNKLNKGGSDKKVWMIFRAGYSKEPTRSFRLETSDIIIN